MDGKLTVQQRQQLGKWIGPTEKRFNLLFSITRDGCKASTFHKKCDNQGATVTVAFNTAGYVYGAFTSQPWSCESKHVTDLRAFLFCLNNSTKIPVIDQKASTAIYCHPDYGPTFGAGPDMMLFMKTIEKNGSTYKLNSTFSLGQTYGNTGCDITRLTGGANSVTELEVYSVHDIFNDPWRKTPEWTEEFFECLKKEVGAFKPMDGLGLRDVQILLIGPVGAGKSSFYNTINSVFRGRVSSQAPSGSVQHSLTTQYRKYKVIVRESGKATHFRLCDTMGLEEEQGMDAADIPFLLDGNVPDRYQFNPASYVTRDIPQFNATPSLKEKIHCVAVVLDCGKVNNLPERILQKIQSIRHHINQRAIPIVVLLTKVDTVCRLVQDDISKVFHSPEVQAVVDRTSDMIGVPRSHVLLVKNYEHEIELESKVNTLALMSIRQMLWYASDFLCNEADHERAEHPTKMHIKGCMRHFTFCEKYKP